MTGNDSVPGMSPLDPDGAGDPDGYGAGRSRNERTGRRVAMVGGAIVLGIGAVYAGAVAFTPSTVPGGTTVLGVDVGGMSRDEAIAALTAATDDLAAEPIDLRVRSAHVSLDPASAGLSFDPAATIDSVMGRQWNPLARLSAGTADLTPVVRVDQMVLSESLHTVAADTDQAPVEPSVTIADDGPRLEKGSTGHLMDVGSTAAAVTAAYLHTDEVSATVTPAEPTVSPADAQAALAQARSAIAAPVTVTVGAVRASIPASVIADSLTYEVRDGRLAPVLDGDALRASIAAKVAPEETPGRDATWKIKKGKPVVVPSKVGRGVSPDALATSVAGVLDQSGVGRTVAATIGAIQPARTTAQAQALGITEQLSTFTQNFPYAAYRVQNIGQAAKYMNGTVLEPGQVYSMNDTIKERTVANGYTVGTVIGSGGIFEESLGGGVSTATTATWTAAFFAGLERVHTQAHSIWISRYQPGLEATVAWGSFDMQFRNDTPDGVLITTKMTNTSITVSMWGTKQYDKIRDVSGPRTNVVPYKTIYDQSPGCHSQSGVPGFRIVVTREFITDGKVVKKEPITTVYQPSPTVICGKDPSKKPDKKPKPDPSASPTPAPSSS